MPLAKLASAGCVLALASTVSLAVSGCGGGSSSAQTAGTTAAAGAEGASAANASKESAAGGSAGAASSGTKPPSSHVGAPPGSGKHGPRIAQPKGTPEPKITAKQREEATVASIALESPALEAIPNGVAKLPATYTCDGADSWPAIEWKGIPQGTAELVLFVMSVKPVEGKIFFDWAVAGLDPALGGIEAAKLPKGVVMGQNSFGQSGYSICPVKGEDEHYFFALYALPKALSPGKGFDPDALRKQVSAISASGGLMAASYARG